MLKHSEFTALKGVLKRMEDICGQLMGLSRSNKDFDLLAGQANTLKSAVENKIKKG